MVGLADLASNVSVIFGPDIPQSPDLKRLCDNQISNPAFTRVTVGNSPKKL